MTVDHRQIKAYAVVLYTSTRHILLPSGDKIAAIDTVAFEISYNDINSWNLKIIIFLDPSDSSIACVRALSQAKGRNRLNSPFETNRNPNSRYSYLNSDTSVLIKYLGSAFTAAVAQVATYCARVVPPPDWSPFRAASCRRCCSTTPITLDAIL